MSRSPRSASQPGPGPSSRDTLGVDALVLAAEKLGEHPLGPRRFLRGLAVTCAGIRFGPLGLVDLALGGRNPHPGRGFRAAYDDGTRGQARHFAGVAYATAVIGAPLTRLAMRHVLRDPAGSADDRLSRAAIRFAGLLASGELRRQDAAEWLRDELAA